MIEKNNIIERDREKITAKINRNIKIGFVLSVPFLLYGIIKLLFLPAGFGTRFGTMEPYVINGWIPILTGIGFILGSIHGIRKREFYINKELKRISENRKEKHNQPNWTKHY